MTIHDFVLNLFEAASAPEMYTQISAFDAAADLDNFRAESWDIPKDITPEAYAAEWNALAFSAKLARDWDAIVNLMNDDIRETVHAELAPCENVAFLKRYCKLDPDFAGILRSEFSIEL